METRPLSDLKAHLSEYVQRAEVEHERYTITRNGRPSVVLLSADDWESIEATLDLLSTPGMIEKIQAAEEAAESGDLHDETEVRARLGLRSAG
jgi:prevent-host-death family protein